MNTPDNRTKEELEAELYEANEYIEELQAKLDDIIGIAGGDDEDADEEEGDGQDTCQEDEDLD